MTSEHTQTVLLSIKPQWAEAILDGSKAYEFRTQPPAMDPQYDALLYASAPEKAIIARVTVDEVVTAPVDELITTTLSEVPHTAAMLQEYFAGRTDGSALHIDAAERLSTPVEIATLRECGVSVPQNFQYLKPGRDDALLSRLDAVSVAE